MSPSPRILTGVILALVFAPSVAVAIPDVWSEWTWTPGDWVSIIVTPEANGSTLDQAFLAGGTVADATLTMQLWIQGDTFPPEDPEPIVGYPAEDIWLWPQGDHWVSCLGANWIPDGPSDDDGWVTFDGPFAAGGWNTGADGGLVPTIAGSPLENRGGALQTVPIRFNSPDIDGNRAVNLGDVTLFATDYFGGYDYRSDFDWDGQLNLIDVSLFALFIGEQCD